MIDWLATWGVPLGVIFILMSSKPSSPEATRANFYMIHAWIILCVLKLWGAF